MPSEQDNITYLGFWPKMYNLNLIMRKLKTHALLKSRRRKNCILPKYHYHKQRQRKWSWLKKPKEMRQLNAILESRLDSVLGSLRVGKVDTIMAIIGSFDQLECRWRWKYPISVQFPEVDIFGYTHTRVLDIHIHVCIIYIYTYIFFLSLYMHTHTKPMDEPG